MASFYDTTVGQQVEFQRVLASAGFTDSDIARIIKQPELAAVMHAAIQPAARVQLAPTGLTPVADYTQLIYERSELRGWRLSEKMLSAFERQVQQHPGHAGQLQPTGVTMWLGGNLAQNWAEAMAWLRDGLEALGYSLREYFTPDQLSLYQADSPTRKGLCLAELNLARHWDREYGLVPREVRQKAARWP